MISRREVVLGLGAEALASEGFAQPTLRPVRLLVARRIANVPANNCTAPCIRGSVYDVTNVSGPISAVAILAGQPTPICDVIERPWAGNAANVSSVPKGVYAARVRTDATKSWMIATPSRAWRIEIAGVPGGRSAIQFHYGTDASWSQGCFIVGKLLQIPAGGVGAGYCQVTGADAALTALKNIIEAPGRDTTRIEVTVADSGDLFSNAATHC